MLWANTFIIKIKFRRILPYMTDDDRRSMVETSQINKNKSKYSMKLLNFIFIINVLTYRFWKPIDNLLDIIYEFEIELYS